MLLEDFAVEGHKLILSGENANGIFEIDRQSKKLSLLFMLEQPEKRFRRYGSTIKYKDKFFFTPLSEDHILVYERQKNTIDKIPLPPVRDKTDERMENDKLLPFAMWNNMLYLFPWRYPLLVRLNMDTYETKVITDWRKDFEGYITNRLLTYFRKDVVSYDGSAYLITWNYPLVLKFDMETGGHEMILLEKCPDGFSTICRAGQWLLLSDRKGRVYKTDNLFSIIEDIELSRECEGIIFKESFFLDGKVWLVPVKGKMLVWLDGETSDSGTIAFGTQGQDDVRFLCVKPMDSHTILLHTSAEELFTFDTERKEVNEFQIQVDEAEEKYLEGLINGKRDRMLCECNRFSCSFRRYIDVMKKSHGKEDQTIISERCGDRIYEWMKKSV